jgi:hypothetical protein
VVQDEIVEAVGNVERLPEHPPIGLLILPFALNVLDQFEQALPRPVMPAFELGL